MLQSVEKTKRAPNALREPLNRPLMLYTRPDFDRAMLKFRLILKLVGRVGGGGGQVAPPAPPVGGPDKMCIFQR